MNMVQAKRVDTVVARPPLRDPEKVAALKASIDVTDPESVMNFGVDAQRSVSEFSDGVLGLVRSKDSGHVGVLLSDLASSVKSVDTAKLSVKRQSPFGRMLGGLFDHVGRFVGQYERVAERITDIEGRLAEAREELGKDVALMEALFERSLGYFEEIESYIAAGEEKLGELRETELAQLREAAESGGPVERQHLADFEQLLLRLERKIHDLKLSRALSLQTLPQVRMIQHNNQQLAEKIQSSIVNTIPLWKSQMVVALTLYRQKVAVEVQTKVSDATNELLLKNAEMLKDGSVAIAEQNERGLVDLSTLKKTQEDLVQAIEQTLLIQKEARQKRALVEKELVSMEDELKTKLMNAK